MKKGILLLFVLTTITGIQPVYADVAFFPSWTWSENSIYADWDTWKSDGSKDAWYAWINNGWSAGVDSHTAPYYEDFAGNSLTVSDIPGDNRDEIIQVNNVGAGGLVFYMDNYDTPNPEKTVRVIVNYLATIEIDGQLEETGLTVLGFNVWTGSPDDEEPIIYDAGDPVGYTLQDDGWAIAAFDFVLRPNPEQEWIELIFGYDEGQYAFTAEDGEVFIDELQIHTRCVPIPLPGAFIILASGLTGLVGIRRRYNN